MAALTVLVTFVGVQTEPPSAALSAVLVRLVVERGIDGARSVEADVTDCGHGVARIARPGACAMLQPFEIAHAPVAQDEGHASVDLPGLSLQVGAVAV